MRRLHRSAIYHAFSLIVFVYLSFAIAPGSSALAAEKLEPIDKAWLEANYTKHEQLIPMRDHVRLFTAWFTPKDISTNYPFLLTRTPYGNRPYGVDAYGDPARSLKWFGRERFIFVSQDVRGRNGSEGQFVHVRPIRSDIVGSNEVDESTDTYDTIEWLLKNVANNNGRAGMTGISYPGFYASCGAVNSHPALKAISPQAPIADWFIGDDFRHNGVVYLPHGFGFLSAFEQRLQKPTRESPKPFDYETPNGYEFFLSLGSLSNAEDRFFKGSVPYWNELLEHETYDEFWKARNIRPHLTNVHASVMTVGGWFDAEDLFGALHTYRSIETQNPGIRNILVMGPWAHGQWHSDDGEKLGMVPFRSKTAEFFRQEIELPFFRKLLKGDGVLDLPEAFVFETGTCQWQRYESWPPPRSAETSFYLRAGGVLSATAPTDGDVGFDEYISDPMKPVPFIPQVAVHMTREHMLEDQRFAGTRPDVLVYQTDPLTEDLTVAGPIAANLQVSTTGTDSDWVMKLIDVYPGDFPNPDPNPSKIEMGGYQQLVRGEAMRGKFRNGFDKPEPFTPGKAVEVSWALPDVCHTFRRGHRMMVQIQSSWFPLVDRNPQTFCNIPKATASDFVKATQRVYRNATAASQIRVRVFRTSTP